MDATEQRSKLSPAQVALCIAIQLVIFRPDEVQEEGVEALEKLVVQLLTAAARGGGSNDGAISTGGARTFTEVLALIQARLLPRGLLDMTYRLVDREGPILLSLRHVAMNLQFQ